MNYKIKKLANIAGVSVRTLHHYDQLGLLKPDFISDSGYRFYNQKNLEQLQQILFFKELDFSLKEIKEIMDNPSFDHSKALENHKNLLIKKRERLDKIINTVEKTIFSIKGNKKMKEKELFKGFDMSEIEEHKKKYAEETKQKWGHTDAYKESKVKTDKYTKTDWERITNEQQVIYQKVINNMDKGFESDIVQEAVEELRLFFNKNFYTCSPEFLKGLSDMWVNDERFTKNIDKFKEGLALFLHKAIGFYCENLEKS